jgi:flagellar basal-body rod protein FlgC
MDGVEGVSALGAIGQAAAVAADNLANAGTPGFKAGHAVLETGPGDQGVRLAEVRRDPQPGPLEPGTILVRSPEGAVSAVSGLVEGSNVDPARELVGLMTFERAFEANVAALRAWDETTGLLVNLRV